LDTAALSACIDESSGFACFGLRASASNLAISRSKTVLKQALGTLSRNQHFSFSPEGHVRVGVCAVSLMI